MLALTISKSTVHIIKMYLLISPNHIQSTNQHRFVKARPCFYNQISYIYIYKLQEHFLKTKLDQSHKKKKKKTSNCI